MAFHEKLGLRRTLLCARNDSRARCSAATQGRRRVHGSKTRGLALPQRLPVSAAVLGVEAVRADRVDVLFARAVEHEPHLRRGGDGSDTPSELPRGDTDSDGLDDDLDAAANALAEDAVERKKLAAS